MTYSEADYQTAKSAEKEARDNLTDAVSDLKDGTIELYQYNALETLARKTESRAISIWWAINGHKFAA